MSRESSDAQPAPQADAVPLAVFSAANTAAIHLLDSIQGSLSATVARQFIKDVHASMHIHPKSGVLMLKTTSMRPVVYEHGDMGQEDQALSLLKRHTCVLRRSQNFVRFGDYRVVLEFIAQDQDVIKVRPTGYRNLHPSPALYPIPMAHTKTSNCKTRRLHYPYASTRIKVAHQYKGKRDRGVLGIMDVWCEHNISPPCTSDGHKKFNNDTTCKWTFYSMPLAKNSFCDMPWADIAFKKCLGLFYQTLVGLAKLHWQKIAHGSILPESLLIVDDSEPSILAKGQSPLKRAFISLSMQKRKKKPNASICIAPEALAASWLFAFIIPPKNIKITKQSYGGLKVTIEAQAKKGLIKEPFARLLRQMLAPIREQNQAEEDNRKRKRVEMMKGNGTEKRVRVLSPEPDE
ncbi:hypothetical protein V8C35DRAFT_325947 [Trichoderma chlorosporum]